MVEMELEQYKKYILCISEYGNLTKAAKTLEISQPALSMALVNTEKKLGFQIFKRKKSPLCPTPEGEIYIEYLKREQQMLQDCKKQISDLQDEGTGSLIVGAPAVYAQTVLVDTLRIFCEKYPQCKVTIKEAPFAELVRMTEKGQLDCFINTSEKLPHTFGKQVLKPERFYLGIPAKWEINESLKEYQVSLGEKKPAPDFSLLSQEAFIFLEPEQPLQVAVDRFLFEQGVTPQGKMVVNQIALGVKLAAQGTGMIFASEEGLQQSGVLDKLCIYSLPEGIAKRMIYVAYNENHYISAMCQNYLEVLKSYYK